LKARPVLSISYIKQSRFQTIVIIYEPLTSAFGPPIATNETRSVRSKPLFLNGLEAPSTPRFKSSPNQLRLGHGCHDEMHMVRPTIHRIEVPSAVFARFAHLLLNRLSLAGIQATSVLSHPRGGFEVPCGVGHFPTVSKLDPSALIAWKPCAVT